MSFTDSFNSSLRGGALLQGIFYAQEQRDLNKKVQRADEYARGITALENQFGSANPGEWGAEGQALLRDHMNAFKDVGGVGDRPGGQANFDSIVPAGDGIAAVVTVDDGKGNKSTGPITHRGSSDPDDPVSVVNNTEQLKAPVLKNMQYQQQRFQAMVNSPNAHKMLTEIDNQRNTENDLETYYNYANGGSADTQDPVQTPAPQNAPQEPAPVIEDGPAEGLQSASAGNPAAVTSPGPQPPSAPQAATPYGKFTAPREWVSPKAQDITMAAAQANGIDPELFQAVVYHESAGGDINAQSPTGASGLGQMTGIAVDEVNRVYGTNYTREQMRTDPEANADASAKLLKYELEQHNGNVEQALAAYNGGRGALKKAGGDYTKMRPETAEYPGKVLALLSGSSDAAASPEAGGLSTASAEPSTQSSGLPPRAKRRGGRNAAHDDTPLKAVDRDIRIQEEKLAAAEAKGPQKARGGKNATTPAKAARQKLERLRAEREQIVNPQPDPEEVAAQEAATAEADAVTAHEAQVDDFIASFSPKDASEEKVVSELKDTAAPQSQEEVTEVAEAIKQAKPAERIPENVRKAVYRLHRLNPTQMPLGSVVGFLKSGRLTKKNVKYMQNAVGQTIQYDEDTGTQKVMAETPENQAYIDAKLSKANYDANISRVQDKQNLEKNQLAQTESRTNFAMEQSVNIHGNDPELMAQHRDKFNTTAQTMGLNLDDQATPTAINTAARVQKLYNSDNGPAWWNLWLKDEPYNNDYSFGMAVQNMPDSPFDPRSPDDDEVIKAGEHYKTEYLDPIQKGFPNLSKQKTTQATYMATHLEKRGMSRADALRVAGTVIGNSRFQTVGEAIKVADQKMAAFVKK